MFHRKKKKKNKKKKQKHTNRGGGRSRRGDWNPNKERRPWARSQRLGTSSTVFKTRWREYLTAKKGNTRTKYRENRKKKLLYTMQRERCHRRDDLAGEGGGGGWGVWGGFVCVGGCDFFGEFLVFLEVQWMGD